MRHMSTGRGTAGALRTSWAIVAALTLGAAMVIGCDESSDTYAPVDTPPADVPRDKPEEPKAPTTQSLSEAPRITLPLRLIPFSIEAPDSWEVKTYDSREAAATMLRGPVAGDEAHVAIGLRDKVTGQVIDLLTARLMKEHDQLQKLGGGVTVRVAGDVKVIDIRRLPTTVADPKSDIVEWRVILYKPAGVSYEQYELKFIGLTVQAYRDNAAWLSKMLETLKYDDTGAPPMPAGL
jgi:hypothetical protein